MSDELFPETHSTPPRLTAARQRAEKAETAYNAAGELEAHEGDPVPKDIMAELRDARRELAAAEVAEYRSRSGL